MILFLHKDPLKAALLVKDKDQEKLLNHYLFYILGSNKTDRYSIWLDKRPANRLWLIFKSYYLLGKIEQRGLEKPLQNEIIMYFLTQKQRLGPISKIPDLKNKTLLKYENTKRYRLLYRD